MAPFNVNVALLALTLLHSLTADCTIVNNRKTVDGRIRHRHNMHQHHQQHHFVERQSAARSRASTRESSSGPTPRPITSCPNCLYKSDNEIKTETDNLRLEAIKRQILSKLGLKSKPNVTHTLPREMILETLVRADDSDPYAFDAIVDGRTAGKRDESRRASTSSSSSSSSSPASSVLETVDVDDFYGRTSEIITFAERGHKVNENRLLEFQVSAESSGHLGQEFRVKAATLWLKADVRYPRATKCKSTDIYVFKFFKPIRNSVRLNTEAFNDAIDEPITLQLNETKSGWQKLDVTGTVRKWLLENGRDRLRLFVDCSCCGNWKVHVFNNGDNERTTTTKTTTTSRTKSSSSSPKENDSNRPFLVIHTDPTTSKRVRRRALDCSIDSGDQCCKQRFYVSFKQLGWDDWVIAPQGYYANYCRGDCGGHHRTPDTFVTYHTHVIEEMRKSRHLSGMQPCCAPLKFSSMSLIYFGPDSNIIKRDLPKMVVDECGCP